ncbi:phosphonate ABC transporter ATP-binding protein [Salinibacterium sp. ZJ450]|uniref:phosphonate ABC transporter ATP-binding protein n=1 Tax=Salinibacterium sp. ZJ450 TaxID=2708338 RepID=UPI001423E8FB|nr:phosphonate ABC transporter ATP-binding protein [Salinibacterium sp. ZJ450]
MTHLINTSSAAGSLVLPAAAEAVVTARNVRVHYGNTLALDGLDLSVSPGEVVALLGHSGSGKSTLMRSLTQMAPATADELRVGGRDVLAQHGAELRALRSEVGYVFQHFNLVPNLSALTNVLTGGLYRSGTVNLFGGFSSTQRDEALRLLDRVGLEHKARQQARTLSGGQQQRVAIARALMQQPKLILADEPVASLDPRLAGSVLGLLREIAHEQNIPVIVSLHVVALAKRYADRIVGLHAGRTVFDGTPAELTPAVVSDIYGFEGEFGA